MPGSRRERGHVVGELALEKGRGVGAVDGQRAQRPELADDGRIAGGSEFTRPVTECADRGSVERRAAGEQESGPGAQDGRGL